MNPNIFNPCLEKDATTKQYSFLDTADHSALELMYKHILRLEAVRKERRENAQVVLNVNNPGIDIDV